MSSSSSHSNKRKRGNPASTSKAPLSKSAAADNLNIIEAPETRKFNSPLPAQGTDTRKALDMSKPIRYMDMTDRNGVKRGADDIELGVSGDYDEDEMDDDDDELDAAGPSNEPKKKWSNKRNATSTGRRKITISYIDDKAKRHVSFTKRKSGLMKKAFELSTLTGTNCLVLVVSETGLVYTYSTPGLKPIIAHEDGKDVIARTLRGELTVDGDGLSDVPQRRSQASTSGPKPDQRAVDQGNDHHASELSLPHLSDVMSVDFDAEQPNQLLSQLLNYSSSSFDALFAPAPDGPAGTSVPPGLMPNSMPHVYPATSAPNQPMTSQPFSLPPLDPAVTADERQMTTSTSSAGQVPALPPLPSPPPPRTAWERAAAEHAVAFQSYQARTAAPVVPTSRIDGLPATAAFASSHSLHDFPESARRWQPPERPAVMDDTLTLEERRRVAREEANAALQDAFSQRTIAAYIRAHSAAYKASQAVPSRVTGTAPLSGIELTLDLLRAMCDEGKIQNLDLLGPAFESFLGEYLPGQHRFNGKMLNEARQHIMLFLDFLEGHELITSAKHDKLATFFPTNLGSSASGATAANSSAGSTPNSLAPSRPVQTQSSSYNGQSLSAHASGGGVVPAAPHLSPLESPGMNRKRALTDALANWAEEVAKMRHHSRVVVDESRRIEGWFETVKARDNFALLRARDRMYGPREVYKTRLPRSIASQLRTGDALWLSMRRLDFGQAVVVGAQSEAYEAWIPVLAGPVDIPPGPALPDTDPDLSVALASARQQLEHDPDRSTSGGADGEEARRRLADSVALYERAKVLLDQGDVPE